MEKRTVSELLSHGQVALEEAGIEEAATDARLLLESVLNKTRTELFLAAQDTVDQKQLQQYENLLARRLKREPVSYILETREFWSLPFFVSPAVLIPRPETEFLLEKVFEVYSEKRSGKAMDLCCGSGIIACILAKELPAITVTAVDISDAALQVAVKNCKYHGLEERIQFIQSDLFDQIDDQEQFSLIVSNPPYITTSDVANNLEPEVAQYEPKLALDGGENGLDVIEKIAEHLPSILVRPAHFFMEFGAEQGEACRKIFTEVNYFTSVTIHKDYAGRDRVLHAYVE